MEVGCSSVFMFVGIATLYRYEEKLLPPLRQPSLQYWTLIE